MRPKPTASFPPTGAAMMPERVTRAKRKGAEAIGGDGRAEGCAVCRLSSWRPRARVMVRAFQICDRRLSSRSRNDGHHVSSTYFCEPFEQPRRVSSYIF